MPEKDPPGTTLDAVEAAMHDDAQSASAGEVRQRATTQPLQLKRRPIADRAGSNTTFESPLFPYWAAGAPPSTETAEGTPIVPPPGVVPSASQQDPASSRQALTSIVSVVDGKYPLDALKLPPSNGPVTREVLKGAFAALKDEVAAFSAVLSQADPEVVLANERLSILERRLESPIESSILARAHAMRLDATDAEVRSALEASFLELHVPQAVWLMAKSRGEDDSRVAPRRALITTVEVRADTPADAAWSSVRADNLSSTGIGLNGVPETIADGTQIAVSMHLPGAQRAVRVQARVMWRNGDRVGAHFLEVTRTDQGAIDLAVDVLAEVPFLAERYLELQPNDPHAVASAGISRYVESGDEASERAAIDALANATKVFPNSAHVHLAYAKVCIAAGFQARAAHAIRHAEELERSDPRIAELRALLASKRASHPAILLAWWRAPATGNAARVAAAGTFLVILATLVVLVVRTQIKSPYDAVAFTATSSTLPCSRVSRAKETIMCTTTPEAYRAIAAGELRERVRGTRSAVGPGVANVLIYAENNDFIATFVGASIDAPLTAAQFEESAR